LREYLIGTGGWAYFHVPGLHPLVAYSKAFNFVEVNSTFYRIPSLKEVEKWRKLVPPDFQFTVRANRAITHKHKLHPVQEAFEMFDTMKQICATLNADFLHLQTPPSLTLTETAVKDLRNFLASANAGKLRLALEIRGKDATKLPVELVKAMQDYDMVHSVDISKSETPAYKSDTLYSRLFGKGQQNIYQPTDGELEEIDRKVLSGSFEKVVMSFHFVRMYKDAARLKIYKETGKFPPITKSTGISSLEEVLREDAQFPSTKRELVYNQGWKLFDLTKDRRVHASDLLQELPEKTYDAVDEVITALSPKVR
jgi:uncharacterized protein YecE (DUF72 family)